MTPVAGSGSTAASGADDSEPPCSLAARAAAPVSGMPDSRVAAATAKVRVEGGSYRTVVGVWVDFEEGCDTQRHGGGAVPALRGARLDQRLLSRVEPSPGRQPFDGGDRPAGDIADRRLARQHRLSVDEHRAGAALALAAARLGTGEAE